MYKQIRSARYDFPEEEWAHVSSAAKDLVCSMLTLDPRLRATAADCLRHPWISRPGVPSRIPFPQKSLDRLRIFVETHRKSTDIISNGRDPNTKTREALQSESGIDNNSNFREYNEINNEDVRQKNRSHKSNMTSVHPETHVVGRDNHHQSLRIERGAPEPKYENAELTSTPSQDTFMLRRGLAEKCMCSIM